MGFRRVLTKLVIVMKKSLLLFALLVVMAACSQAETQDNSIPQEQLDKMKSRDFKAHITVVVHEGELKGDYVFERVPGTNSLGVNISIEHEYGPGYKDEETKKVAITVNNMPQKDTEFKLSLFEIGFDGLIKEGSFAVRPRKKGGRNPLRFKDERPDAKWSEARGELHAKSDVNLTYVGPWLDIKGKTEVRRIEGTFTDDVTFTYDDRKKQFPEETVPITVTFSSVQIYSPLMRG